MQARLFHLHALSALHCGTGQAVGAVDLPIARARATQLPIVPGSSLRGVLRAHLEAHASQQRDVVDVERSRDIEALFGPRQIGSADAAFAGALAVGDAHLLLLPVRALAGIVCYVTSPFILNRYRRERLHAGLHVPQAVAMPGDGQARVAPDSVNCMKDQLVLEDLDLTAQHCANTAQWIALIAGILHADDADAREDLQRRIAVLPDDILSYLAETATEVRARIAIDPETGTVRRGALWYEENLPAESVLWGMQALSASNRRGDTREAAALARCLPGSGTVLQLGGKAGVGHGLVRLLCEESNDG